MANILILGGGIESFEGIEHVKRLGHKVVLCDINENAIGRVISDFFIRANIYNEEEVLREVIGFLKSGDNIDGVVAIATDTTKTVARITGELGLSGLSYETAILATDKIKMKRALGKYGIKTPDFYEIKDCTMLEDVIKDAKNKTFVLKPSDSRGARGVLRIDSDSDIESCFNYSLGFSFSKILILEEWIDGPQLSVESIIWDDEYFLCGIADRNYSRLNETYPYVIEDGGETPSKYSEKLWSELNQLMYRSSKAVGLNRGTIKGDIIIGEDGIYIIEIAARLSGGYFSTITIPSVYGNDIIKAAVDISLNIKPDFQALSRDNIAYQANRFLFLKPGVVKDIRLITGDIIDDPLVKKLVLYINIGDKINSVTDHTKRCGMVLCIGEDRESVVSKCVEVISALKKSIIIE